MTIDKIYSTITMLDLEISYLRNVYWEFRAGIKNENELRIAYNNFRSRTQCVCKEDDNDQHI